MSPPAFASTPPQLLITATEPPRVGVLALQGNFAQHCTLLSAIGITPICIRTVGELDTVEGLVIPGGESTTITKLLPAEFFDGIRRFAAAGRPVLGTCAGLILLAKRLEPEDPMVRPMGLLDVVVRRNAYGRQVHSSFSSIQRVGAPSLSCAFIRAPLIVDLGAEVEVLARRDGEPCAVRQGNIVALSFHPEMSGVGDFHEIAFGFLRKQ